MNGAQALVETLIVEGTGCVYGIPGALENELWDTMKSKCLPYLLCTHEHSASMMADGYARSTGKPGVICVVPGCGLTNALTGIGEALLDSVPMVCIVGDIAIGKDYKPFQVHSLPQVPLLQPVTKQVIAVRHAGEIPLAVRRGFQIAQMGEPGPVGVVVPYNLLIDVEKYNSGPLGMPEVPFDEVAAQCSLSLLQNRRLRVGIYAGYGCMNYSPQLIQLAETLQAPVATSMAGKGVMPENHPLSVGWGYGPQGTRTAEKLFKSVDLVLAIGVKYGEVSTGFYSQPQSRYLLHVDANEQNLGKVMKTTSCVHADAGVYIDHVLKHSDRVVRSHNGHLVNHIRTEKRHEAHTNSKVYARCGADPMAFLLALRRCTNPDALAFVDVTVSQYWATEVFGVPGPRTFFNPTNNQSMGWSIPAAIGAQKVHCDRQVVTVTGDGCFLMSGMEMSTAAREGLPVKFFVFDDQAYHYMQVLQEAAYLRTTATILARMDYAALAKGWGVGYNEIHSTDEIEAGIVGTLQQPGPVLCRVAIDYRKRPIRWFDAVRSRYINELSTRQQIRVLARLGTRAVDLKPENND